MLTQPPSHEEAPLVGGGGGREPQRGEALARSGDGGRARAHLLLPVLRRGRAPRDLQPRRREQRAAVAVHVGEKCLSVVTSLTR